jgi:hypothetical protein
MCSKSIPNSTTETIPYGYCHCGCGQKTDLCPRTVTSYGWVKDEPRKYVRNHHSRKRSESVWDEDLGCFLVYLTHGKFALVDADDIEKISAHKWYVTQKGDIASNSVYALRTDYSSGKPIQVLMHHVILPPPEDMFIDHINRNGLDNRRANLRIATQTENARNAKRRKNNRTGYIGVKPYRRGGFEVAIRDGKKDVYLGLFADAVEGAIFRDVAALELHGEFAALNFPELRTLLVDEKRDALLEAALKAGKKP